MWFLMVVLATLWSAGCAIPCEEARLKCAYRKGCGTALQNYLMMCSSVLDNPEPSRCPEVCQYSLIALTSTEEGKNLMECECSDDFCEEQKRRSDICRPQVMAYVNQTVVSCRIAQLICAADALCSTALDYYNRYCKAMFNGKKCTPRCNNSINILTRQEKAAKLTTCKCDGHEDYDCHGIRRNMDKLCFHKHKHHKNSTRHDKTPDLYPTVVLTSKNLAGKVNASFLVLVTFFAFVT
ncbi:unnamed protein product [Brassicogethes aeneus]|uniref:GDNF/GAS1 domain-containing protein n=1 Tax=Brassicogethes aeneus TaxID=1431903 RepID=A0A9P0FFG4_BRAAE|nr:unnamed protein product [Brassicogethes aeneus]